VLDPPPSRLRQGAKGPGGFSPMGDTHYTVALCQKGTKNPCERNGCIERHQLSPTLTTFRGGGRHAAGRGDTPVSEPFKTSLGRHYVLNYPDPRPTIGILLHSRRQRDGLVKVGVVGPIATTRNCPTLPRAIPALLLPSC
jgi:hypothetical protein